MAILPQSEWLAANPDTAQDNDVQESDTDEPAAAAPAPDGDSATQKSAVDAHDASEALRRQLSLGGEGGKPAQTKSKKKDQVQRELHVITVQLESVYLSQPCDGPCSQMHL